jgi:hypothetical protein
MLIRNSRKFIEFHSEFAPRNQHKNAKDDLYVAGHSFCTRVLGWNFLAFPEGRRNHCGPSSRDGHAISAAARGTSAAVGGGARTSLRSTRGRARSSSQANHFQPHGR